MKKEIRDITKIITEAKTFLLLMTVKNFLPKNNVENMRNLLVMLIAKGLKKF